MVMLCCCYVVTGGGLVCFCLIFERLTCRTHNMTLFRVALGQRKVYNKERVGGHTVLGCLI